MKVILRSGIALCITALLVLAALLAGELREQTKADNALETVREVRTAPEGVLAEHAPQSLFPLSIDFQSGELHENILGWIYSPDTPIDHPVVQGADNDYYLSRLYNGESYKGGSIYLDYRNNPAMTDRNTVLYGHHMGDDTMFSSLENYREQAYYDEHPVLYYQSESGSYEIHLFAGMIVNRDQGVLLDFDSDEEFLGYIDFLTRLSFFRSDVEMAVTDQMITLCTCTSSFNDSRTLLFGRLVRVE